MEILPEMHGSLIKDSMSGIKSQGIDVKILEPIQRVVDKIIADAVRPFLVKVYGIAPGCVILIGEVRPVFAEVISLRTQMVVHNIHDHRDSSAMALIHKLL